jgi:hypothetical protein
VLNDWSAMRVNDLKKLNDCKESGWPDLCVIHKAGA